MRLEILDGPAIAERRWIGAVLCRDVNGAGRRPLLLKGRRLVAGDAAILAGAELEELHLLWPEPGDVDEDAAATRLAQVIAGAGVEIHRPVESQVRLSAVRRGRVRVDTATLAALNAVDAVTVFTLPDGIPVEPGRTVAGVKVTPLTIPEPLLAEAERLAFSLSGDSRTLTVRGFLPLRLAAVVRHRISDEARLRFERSLRARADWFGGSVASVDYAPSRSAAREALLRAATAADLVLVVGVASVDPLESTWRDLLEAGAAVIRRGLPVHPGSSYWLATLAGIPVIGVASCGMLSRRSALDLLLIRCFSGEPLDPAFLAGLGHGGLLGPEQGWRIPSYESAGEADAP
ncbi:MAG: hypothetical protein WCB85_09790 [Candidatus Dormiibacterota bacterium]